MYIHEFQAWNEALPGVQPFWEKYSSGPYGIVIRGWQFSRCASEQVLPSLCVLRVNSILVDQLRSERVKHCYLAGLSSFSRPHLFQRDNGCE
jgi:hypothetical protein